MSHFKDSQVSLWRQIQRQNFTDWKKLVAFIELDDFEHLERAPQFSLNLPRRLAEKIAKGMRNDPILRQFLPTVEERQKPPLFVSDSVGDNAARKGPKLLRKYEGRALLLCTSACPMHCRFCFRQHFDYETTDHSFDQELEIIKQDETLTEIILSGGDPLSLSNRELKSLILRLGEISHIQRLRFHTRFPIGIPERIDEEFLEILEESRLQTFFIIHSNHPHEWDEEIFKALKSVQKIGIPVLSQTVLLKGVNDDVHTLKTLFEMIANRGIIPYYLHQLDRVERAAHFEVAEEKGKMLMKEIAASLSGYAVPRYVREIAGETSKTLLPF
jgi:EF-P beta-lysylation protein EpmB